MKTNPDIRFMFPFRINKGQLRLLNCKQSTETDVIQNFHIAYSVGFLHLNQWYTPLFSLQGSLTTLEVNEIKLIVKDFNGKCRTCLLSPLEPCSYQSHSELRI